MEPVERVDTFLRGFAKKGYTSLFLRQKEAHQKITWAIYTKRSMISYCAPFWRKNTGEYCFVLFCFASLLLFLGVFLPVIYRRGVRYS